MLNNNFLLSSLRYKKNIEDLKLRTDELNKVLTLQPKVFQYKDANQPDIGYIAEDLDKVGLTNFVIYDAYKRPNAIQYDKLTVPLIEIVKRQQKQLNDQQNQIDDLCKRLEKLENLR